jgi:hypothetical protein
MPGLMCSRPQDTVDSGILPLSVLFALSCLKYPLPFAAQLINILVFHYSTTDQKMHSSRLNFVGVDICGSLP